MVGGGGALSAVCKVNYEFPPPLVLLLVVNSRPARCHYWAPFVVCLWSRRGARRLFAFHVSTDVMEEAGEDGEEARRVSKSAPSAGRSLLLEMELNGDARRRIGRVFF